MISKDYGLAYSQIFNLNWKTKNLPIILNNNSWKQRFKLLKTLSCELSYNLTFPHRTALESSPKLAH